MKDVQRHDLTTDMGVAKYYSYVSYLVNKKAIVDSKEVKKTRTSTQNAALHKFFDMLAEALNHHGEYYHYMNYVGELVDVQWTGELVKEWIWRPLQKVITDKKSTTQLTTKEIDPIYEVIHKHYSQKGIELFFPSRFNYFLENV